MNPKKTTSKYIIKLLNNKDKKKILKAYREKWLYLKKKNNVNETEFLEVTEARKKEHNIF